MEVRNILKDSEVGWKGIWEKIDSVKKKKQENKKYLIKGETIQLQLMEMLDEELHSESLFLLFTDISTIQKMEAAKA